MTAEAFEVVCHDDDPQWLEERRKLVTGSVAPQLLGVHRFGSLLGTYLRMRSGADPEEITQERRTLMDWGTDQQNAIVENIRRRLELEAERTGALLRSKEWPFLGCTLDGWVYENQEDYTGNVFQFPFEVKTTRSKDAAELWEEGVPADVIPQVQTQLAVTGAPRALVAAVIFGAPPAFTWVERDDDMIREIVELGREFWECVQNAKPPESDWSKAAENALALMPREPGRVVELDIEAVTLVADLDALRDKKKDLERRIREHKAKLVRKLGDAEVGLLPNAGRITYKSQTRAGFVKVRPEDGDISTTRIAAALHAAGIEAKVDNSKASTTRILRKSKK